MLLLKTGKYTELDRAERDRPFFLGDVKKPFVIGTKGEIYDTVNDEFFAIHDVCRWLMCGMIKIDVEKDPAYICAGVRAIMEFKNG